MATMYFNRGEAYREKGDLDNAIKDLGESINLDGKNANAYFSRATAHARQGRARRRASPTSTRRSSSIRATRRTISHPQPRLLREARLRARHRRSDPGDQAQSEEHADDLQPRHGLSRQGRARARGAGLRSGAEDHAERRLRLSQPRPRLSRHARLRPRHPAISIRRSRSTRL